MIAASGAPSVQTAAVAASEVSSLESGSASKVDLMGMFNSLNEQEALRFFNMMRQSKSGGAAGSKGVDAQSSKTGATAKE